MTRIGVITFPGTLDDVDAARAVHLAGAEPVALWHKDADLKGVDAVVVPGGFSYGDYLRCGAIARFAPVMNEVVEAAGKGMPVLGICNGFQILAEAHLLPGALLRNEHQKFVCREQRLRVESTTTAWTGLFEEGEEITVPLKNMEGNFIAAPPRSSTASRVRALSSSGTSAGTPTDPPATSPVCAMSAETSSGSCRTPSTPSSPVSGPTPPRVRAPAWTACGSSSPPSARWWAPDARGLLRPTPPDVCGACAPPCVGVCCPWAASVRVGRAFPSFVRVCCRQVRL